MKKKIEPKTLADFFLEALEARHTKIHDAYDMYSVYLCLFKIMPIDDLNTVLENAYRDRKKSYWFHDFHKMIRQVDFFSMCYRYNPSPTISKEEQKELDILNEELKKKNKLMDEYEKALSKDVPPTDHPTYIQKAAEYSIKYKILDKELFPEEKWRRRYDLVQKLKREEKKSINGLLDSVLWSSIHLDTHNVLQQSMEYAFEDFLDQKKELAKKKKLSKV